MKLILSPNSYFIGLILLCMSSITAQEVSASANSLKKDLKEPPEKPQVYKIPFSELGLEPELYEEGYHYLFTTYEILEPNKLVVAGTTTTEHFLKIYNFSTQQLIRELTLEDAPVELVSQGEDIIVYGRTKIIRIDENFDIQSKNHPITHYGMYNKWIQWNGESYIYMGDGTAYQLVGLDLVPLDKLKIDNKQIWIQKIAANHFQIKTGQNKLEYKSNADLGSMTPIGAKEGNIIYCIEKVIKDSPLQIERIISSDKDQFGHSLIIRDLNKYSYLKNDIKYREDKLYQVIIENQNIALSIKNYVL